MNRDEIFPSKYLKASDLNGKPITVTIDRAELTPLKSPDGREQSKIVLSFKGAKKSLVVNMTNFDGIADVCGGDTDLWPGHTIELYPTKTSMGGKQVDCIRVRAPGERELPKRSPAPQPSPADSLNDTIPF